jgi:hypothetical protein
MLKVKFIVHVFIAVILFVSCKKDQKIETVPTPLPPVVQPPPATDTASKTGSFVFDFRAFVNGKALKTDTWYVNFNNDSFTVNRFNYYISNIKLKRNDGSVFVEKESYHLIKHIDGKETFTISNVPEGIYSDIEFVIGVDSARNVSGAQTADLDVVYDMFWEWKSGYIFFKIEGDCKVASDPNLENYGWHIGGFSAKNNCLQKCTFTLKNPLIAGKGKRSSVFYHTLLEEIFVQPQNLDIAAISANPSKMFKTVSANYADMFVIDRVQN